MMPNSSRAHLHTAEHPSAQQLMDFLAGRTPKGYSTANIESHLETCAECQELGLKQPLCLLELALQSATSTYPQENTAPAWKLKQAYELKEEIGRGASGVVYRASDPTLKRQVAVKMLLSGSKSHPRQLTRFRREAFSLARLQHANIVTVYDSGEQDGIPYLAMEYIEGGSLDQQLRSAPLDYRVAASLVCTLSLAVQHAHDKGILHRDLKPQNVLLQTRIPDDQIMESTPSSRVSAQSASSADPSHTLPWIPKLGDFGLARFDWPEDGLKTCTGEFLGTPEYMAPELMQSQTESITPSIDIYGLGAILYQCLTGRPPFQGSSLNEITQRVINEEPLSIKLLRPGVPKDLETICLRCLSKSPTARFPTARALADDLHRYLSGESINSRRPGMTQTAWRWCRRNPWRATALAAIVALCASIPSVGIYYGQRLTQQARVASSNYEATRTSLWQVLDHVQKSTGSDIPKLTELSLAQAVDARQLFQRLASEDRSPRATLDLVRAYLLVGSLSVTLGKIAEGEEEFRQAESLCEQVADLPEYRDEALANLASAKTKLATTHRSKDNNRALEYQLAALRIHEELAVRSKDQRQTQSDLAWSHHTLGSIYLISQKTEEAIQHYQLAIDIRKQLEQGTEQPQALSHSIAGSLVNLALAESGQGHVQAAEVAYREAIDRLNAIRVAPESSISNPVLVGDWSSALLNFATLIANAGRADESLTLCTEAIDVLELAHQREPNVAQLRDNLFKHYATRAQLNMFHQNYLAAAEDWKNAGECTNDPNWKRSFSIQRWVAVAQSPDYPQALEQLDGIIKSLEDEAVRKAYNVSDLNFAASIAALAYEAATADQQLDQAAQKSLANACFERIERLLKLSGQTLRALFQNPADLEASHWLKFKAAIGQAQWEKLL